MASAQAPSAQFACASSTAAMQGRRRDAWRFILLLLCIGAGLLLLRGRLCACIRAALFHLERLMWRASYRVPWHMKERSLPWGIGCAYAKWDAKWRYTESADEGTEGAPRCRAEAQEAQEEEAEAQAPDDPIWHQGTREDRQVWSGGWELWEFSRSPESNQENSDPNAGYLSQHQDSSSDSDESTAGMTCYACHQTFTQSRDANLLLGRNMNLPDLGITGNGLGPWFCFTCWNRLRPHGWDARDID